MSDNSVAALAVVCIFGAPVAAFIVIRVLAHREQMELIRRGIMPPQMYGRRKGWRNAEPGTPGFGMPGPGGAPGGPPPAPPHPTPPPGWIPAPSDFDAPDRSLRKGIKMSLVGLALLIGLSFIGYDNGGPFNSPEIRPGPWLLLGLVPMFVGVAQIIIALISGARLGPPGPRPGPPPYPGAVQTPPPGASAYEPEPRTHSGYEELKRPTPPPERR
jgi:hypothetical protein